MEAEREYLENSLETSLLNSPPGQTPDILEENHPPQMDPKSSSSYTLASDQSIFSGDVDHWIRGYTPTETTGVQGSRAAVIQRSTLTTTASTTRPGIWYMLVMMLPLFNVSNSNRWRCSPRTIINTAEVCLTHLGRICNRLRCHVRTLARNQLSREIFAAMMDIVLVVYAIGFLILSMYQASIIG